MVERPLADQFHGDRTGGLKDPFGHFWYVAAHIEDVSPEELVGGPKSKSREL